MSSSTMIALPTLPGHKFRHSNSPATDYPSPESATHDPYHQRRPSHHYSRHYYQHPQYHQPQYQQYYYYPQQQYQPSYHCQQQQQQQQQQQYPQQQPPDHSHRPDHLRHPSHTYSHHTLPPHQYQQSYQEHRSYQLTTPRSPSGSVMQSPIERLPSNLQKKIFSKLDYQSLIHLSTMNRYFHQIIDPQTMANPVDKAEFVMRAAKDFPQHRPSEKGHDYKPGNFECYICFRVRLPEHFDMMQPQHAYVDTHGRLVTDREPQPGLDRLIFLRRFCIECGVREGLHVPFDCLTTRTGRDLWVCKCRRIWAKPGCLRCPDCRGDCPLRPKKKSAF